MTLSLRLLVSLYTIPQCVLQVEFSGLALAPTIVYVPVQLLTVERLVKIGSIGIDLVDVTRIANLVTRYGDSFLARILGPTERSQLGSRRDRAQFVAGRFAAKEAAIKALGHYLIDRPSYNKIQIVNDTTGQPSLDLTSLNDAKLRGVSAQVSISHERSHAIAIVILTEEP